MELEIKRLSLNEIKLASSANAMEFEGYGAVFGNVDSYGDVIAQGAFTDTLANAKSSGDWPLMLLDHGGLGFSADDNLPVGLWTSLSEDTHGLKVTGKLADTSRGRDLYSLMKMEPRPAIKGLSIGYMVKEKTDGTRAGEPRRTLKKIDLFEVSIVAFPANTKANVTGVKTGRDMTEREFEGVLMRDARLTRSEAVTVINHGFKALKGKRDAAPNADADAVQMLRNLAKTLKR